MEMKILNIISLATIILYMFGLRKVRKISKQLDEHLKEIESEEANHE